MTPLPDPDLLVARLAAGPALLLDGATGTELEARGVPSELPLWSAHALLEHPDIVAAIHRAYAEAGAEAVTANTFRTQRRTLSRAGLGGRAAALTRAAVALARRAVGPAVWVLGSQPPLEDCYRPDLVPDDASLRREHAEHAGHLAAAGVDAILVETHNCARETVAATRAALATGRPVVASVVCDPAGRLLSGEPLADALAGVVALGVQAVGVNCLPPSAVAACLPALREAGRPFGVQANLGAPTRDGGRSEDLSPAAFAVQVRTWLARGARFVGGCCGTRPSHLAAARAARDASRADP